MACTVHFVRGPAQSGKTTIALGALERLRSEGAEVLHVVPTRAWAQDFTRTKRSGVPVTWFAVVLDAMIPGTRAVVVDDMEWLPEGEAGPTLQEIEKRLNGVHGPTQLILVVRE